MLILEKFLLESRIWIPRNSIESWWVYQLCQPRFQEKLWSVLHGAAYRRDCQNSFVNGRWTAITWTTPGWMTLTTLRMTQTSLRMYGTTRKSVKGWKLRHFVTNHRAVQTSVGLVKQVYLSSLPVMWVSYRVKCWTCGPRELMADFCH